MSEVEECIRVLTEQAVQVMLNIDADKIDVSLRKSTGTQPLSFTFGNAKNTHYCIIFYII